MKKVTLIDKGNNKASIVINNNYDEDTDDSIKSFFTLLLGDRADQFTIIIEDHESSRDRLVKKLNRL